LRRWTRELRDNELTKAEFADLVKGQKDLAQLAALTQAGLALAALQRFRDGLMKLVIDTAFKTFLP
jgi:ABC-type ATPase with predicted acetyltransferase domain